MTEYTVKAYPTEYRGRTYRSRLEARWAAFFDLLNWKHEYEPFDLGKWSPDFLLTDMNVLVEVKPITELCDTAYDKMATACEERGILHDTDERDGVNAIVLVGVAPWTIACSSGAKMVQTGWFGTRNLSFAPRPGYIGWIAERCVPEFLPEIIHTDPCGWYAAGGNAGAWDERYVPQSYDEHTMKLWARATGLVQWRPE